jgi:glucokinase
MNICYGGIDLGGSYIKAGLLSENGEIIQRIIVPSAVEKGIPALASNLRKVGHSLIEIGSSQGLKVAGIGVGSPGTIKYPEGIVTGATPNIPGWVGSNISEIFSDFPFPVIGDNDANCMGLAEALFGSGSGTRYGFYITLGTGIGGAVMIEGKLLRGASFCAGEFGHMVLVYNGFECKTGRRGCLEHYVNASGLIEGAKKRLPKFPNSSLSSGTFDVVEIFAAFRESDPAAVEAVSENADMIGTAIGSVVNLLNPEVVVIGGGMSQGGEEYINLIRQSILRYAFDSTTSVLKIEIARFGNEAGWIGAACLNIR